MPLIKEHAWRQLLNDEFHARPPVPLHGTVLIGHLAVQHDGSGRSAELAHLERLSDFFPGKVIERADDRLVFDGGSFQLRWELHTEFSSYTVFQPIEAGTALGTRASGLTVLPEAWLAGIPGDMVVATNIELRSQDEISPDDVIAGLSPGAKQIVVSDVVDGAALVITDFMFEANSTSELSFSSFLMINRGLTQRQTGRTVQRLCEIETYRMFALLGYPVAREIGAWIKQAEEELATLTERIGIAGSTQDEQLILKNLSRLAAEVEHSLARTNFRFAASRAYFNMVKQRVVELRESRVSGFPTFQEFMDRRLLPPMETCAAMARRLEELSGRLSRNSTLLRTRVDLELEQQNQELLTQMNQRAKLQLRLQETVEGLSVVAITYYGSQLVAHLAEGLEKFVHLPPPSVVAAIAIPVIALAAIIGLKRMRRNLAETIPEAPKRDS